MFSKEEYRKKNIIPSPLLKLSLAEQRLEVVISDIISTIIVSSSSMVQNSLLYLLNLILMIHTKSNNFILNNMIRSCYCMSQFPVMKDKNIPEFTT